VHKFWGWGGLYELHCFLRFCGGTTTSVDCSQWKEAVSGCVVGRQGGGKRTHEKDEKMPFFNTHTHIHTHITFPSQYQKAGSCRHQGQQIQQKEETAEIENPHTF
jgi:hypothetical protein